MKQFAKVAVAFAFEQAGTVDHNWRPTRPVPTGRVQRSERRNMARLMTSEGTALRNHRSEIAVNEPMHTLVSVPLGTYR